ncbi:hypothetical protein PHMEG_00010370 [Phytophthora megakarya]|uniref:Uncharacterized protein n=1 Tax=Phytophthora megakarya TaxID=4795 RepID=A0A225WEF4_9STRA|nr:hypothetical protein PHMEG_00010370 [Phytophthora megakarya]
MIYYLHSYTGEVRWPRPETVGFIMHGLKPLPYNAGGHGMVNPDIWSPYYPHVVMLPSGLVQVHSSPRSDTQEMWCGYNRFPLANFRDNSGNGEHRADGAGVLPSGPRMLPPTWEDSRGGSPFLPPYPVTILGRDDMDNPPVVSRAPPQRLYERFQTPEVDAPRSYRQLQNGEVGRVHGSMDWSTHTRRNTSTVSVASNQVNERKQPGGSNRKCPLP